MKPALSVAVRALCEFTARSGDLDLRFTPAPSALEGMEGHAVVQKRREKAGGYEVELALSGRFQELQVRGRADGFDGVRQQLEEIKTYRGRLDGVRPHHRALHWAQARVYGHLLCQERGLERIKLALVYFQIGSAEETVLVEECSATELQAFFESLCARYLDWARCEAAHRQARNEAMAQLKFPMPAFRAGQRELSVAVYRTAHAGAGGRCLMAQAPTGIGKTLATIFPMLKSMAAVMAKGASETDAAGLDKLFFLTAKGTGHGLALHALGQLQQALPRAMSEAAETPVAPLRVLDMQARDKTCEHPGNACHGESCPLARGFFDRLPAARQQALQLPLWDAPGLRTLALLHGICPYYLSQELARWADVVVADYHYYYDSTAMLYALALQQDWRVGVLVDEAHNLLERARSMYTAPLSQFDLAQARQVATGAVKKALDALQRQWQVLNRAQDQASYQSYESIPGALLGAVQRAVGAIADQLAEQETGGHAAAVGQHALADDVLLGFYWELLHFQALADQFGPHALFDIQRPLLLGRAGRLREPSSTLCIRNVVPAPHLAARHAAAQASVLFSGTLSPPGFYRDLLGLPVDTAWLDVPAPFAARQLQVHIARHISTRWRDREASLAPMADLIAQQYARQPGNYLCFVSSFEYLQQVAATVERRHPQLPLWQQQRGMDEAGRAEFLARFVEGGQGLGLAVLGGAFSEGVDLPGSRLIGAFVATLGLPQLNPVNEAMQRAMDQTMGAGLGYDYTYLYPGLRKVVQAAGRVIRSEHDSGVLVLMDDRFARAEVRALLPAWWQIEGPRRDFRTA
ncbi:ATP-dependent DNA helicase [Comamonas sp. Z3]|uniref:helicase C-terminal domain-containing protein n=1 Tax=Comamonas sp. Z3 TaxID=2601247 RepID=UPI0011E6684D|nr:helicase C-terminal domain-containing protein [Comamonas sp. Z3]TYK69868.1 ATP-dependent DNA helicase [Comamonas sp. Z3]